jgi:hypothetical protein
MLLIVACLNYNLWFNSKSCPTRLAQLAPGRARQFALALAPPIGIALFASLNWLVSRDGSTACS